MKSYRSDILIVAYGLRLMAFSLFGKKQKTVLGIDIGAGGAKIVELREAKGRPHLATYAYTERVTDFEKGLIDDPKTLAEMIKKMRADAKMTATRAIAGLPIAAIFSSVMSVPAASGKELKEAIEWQARKLIPLPLSEMVLDWRMIGEKKPAQSPVVGRGLIETAVTKSHIPGLKAFKREGPPELGKKSMRILLTGAAKALIAKYTEFAKSAGLELAALETEAYALIRSLVGKDPSTIMIIDFGTVRTSIVIVEQGVPALTRSIHLGGMTITQAISRTLGASMTDAEQMKRDSEKLSSFGGEAGMPTLLSKIIEPLVTEARYSMNLYKTQQAEVGGGKLIEKIIVTGGSAHLPYLTTHLSSALNINAYVGDPWARILAHEDLRPVLDDLGPRFAVAVGLAMRDFE